MVEVDRSLKGLQGKVSPALTGRKRKSKKKCEFIDDEAEESSAYEASFIDDTKVEENADIHRQLAATQRVAGEGVPCEKDPKLGDKKRIHKFAMGWFLTYPQCPMKKEAMLEALKVTLMNFKLEIKEYVICEEKHENGDPHLHAFIKLDRRREFRADLFDVMDLDTGKNYHGHYETAKSFRAVIKYVTEDGNYISNIDVKAALRKKSKLLPEDLMKKPLDALEEGIITPMQLSSFYKNHLLYMNLKMMQVKLSKEIIEMPKLRHYWVCGDTNAGKTTWLRKKMIDNEDKFFKIPKNNDWVGYAQEDNLYIDEFKGQIKIQELNELCDGGAKVNVKGGSITVGYGKTLYVLSNFDPIECYPYDKPFEISTLLTRFTIYEMKNYELEDISMKVQYKISELEEMEKEKKLKKK